MTYYCRGCDDHDCQFTKEEMIEYDLLDEENDWIIDCFCPYMRRYTDFVQEIGEEEDD